MVQLPYFIVVLGTAGSGKSTLTSALQDYLIHNELDAATVNLDPAVVNLPYKPDIDVRDYVDARDLMAQYGLGPNGALVTAIDMIAMRADEIKEEILGLKSNYIIIDTPGQMEVFAFRESGPITLNILLENSRAVSLFLIDAMYAVKPSNYFSALLLATSTYFRIGLPQILVLNKTDIIEEEHLERLVNYREDPAALAEDIVSEESRNIMIWDREELYVLAEKLSMYELIPVSSTRMEGYDELYASIQRVLAGGEDYLTEEPSPRL